MSPKIYISSVKACRFIRKRYGLRAYLRAVLTILIVKRVDILAYESEYYERVEKINDRRSERKI